ncbi:MAG: hypothetical protein J0H06_08430 [Actinobacteria bacterium]|nr:hypothetical protein [Actinomycetota bacterium]
MRAGAEYRLEAVEWGGGLLSEAEKLIEVGGDLALVPGEEDRLHVGDPAGEASTEEE